MQGTQRRRHHHNIYWQQISADMHHPVRSRGSIAADGLGGGGAGGSMNGGGGHSIPVLPSSLVNQILNHNHDMFPQIPAPSNHSFRGNKRLRTGAAAMQMQADEALQALAGPSLSMVNSSETFAISEVKSVGTVFNWNIQNFRDICNAQTPLDINGQPIFVPFRSSSFTAGAEINKNSEWYVRVQPTSIPSYGSTNPILRQPCVLLVLCLDKILGREKTPINARYAIYAASQTGSPIGVTGFVGMQSKIFHPLNGGTNYDLDTVNAPYIYIGNFGSSTTTLCIQVKLEIISDPIPTMEPVGSDRTLTAETELLSQIYDLWSSKIGADILIQCGTELFQAHKTILSARSPVFARMLEHDMVEKETQKIKIEDIDPTVMEETLKYLYCGVLNIPFDYDLMAGLLHAADKYELEKLKTFCMEELFRHISLENAGHLAVLSYLHNWDPTLKDKINQYIQRNCSLLWKKGNFRKLLVEHPAAFGDDD